MSDIVEKLEILIAEDDETDSFFVEQAFAQSKFNIKAHVVRDGEQVMQFLRREAPYEDVARPHLIFLDLNMPNKGGHDTLAEIKADEKLRRIPVIIISASADQADIDMAYGLHANAYLTKANGFEDMMGFMQAVEQFWLLQARFPSISGEPADDKDEVKVS